jgi:hypothetical protein
MTGMAGCRACAATKGAEKFAPVAGEIVIFDDRASLEGRSFVAETYWRLIHRLEPLRQLPAMNLALLLFCF